MHFYLLSLFGGWTYFFLLLLFPLYLPQKPENLLLADDDGEVLKIADFGLSAIVRDAEEHAFLPSTPTPSPSTATGLLPPSPGTPGSTSSSNSSGHRGSSSSSGVINYPTTPSSGGLARGSSGAPLVASPLNADPHSLQGSSGQGFPTPPSPQSSTTNSNLNLRKLRSVVGSPFYVAPEVLGLPPGQTTSSSSSQGHASSGPGPQNSSSSSGHQSSKNNSHSGRESGTSNHRVNNDPSEGYDGCKADMWSAGVILYAMLAGNLPFGQDLHQCLRFKKFQAWLDQERAALAAIAAASSSSSTSSILEEDDEEGATSAALQPSGGYSHSSSSGRTIAFAPNSPERMPQNSTHNYSHSFNYRYNGDNSNSNSNSREPPAWNVASAPTWLFPTKASDDARHLLCALLVPDPQERLSVHEAMRHPWVRNGRPPSPEPPLQLDAPSPEVPSTEAAAALPDAPADIRANAIRAEVAAPAMTEAAPTAGVTAVCEEEVGMMHHTEGESATAPLAALQSALPRLEQALLASSTNSSAQQLPVTSPMPHSSIQPSGLAFTLQRDAVTTAGGGATCNLASPPGSSSSSSSLAAAAAAAPAAPAPAAIAGGPQGALQPPLSTPPTPPSGLGLMLRSGAGPTHSSSGVHASPSPRTSPLESPLAGGNFHGSSSTNGSFGGSFGNSGSSGGHVSHSSLLGAALTSASGERSNALPTSSFNDDDDAFDGFYSNAHRGAPAAHGQPLQATVSGGSSNCSSNGGVVSELMQVPASPGRRSARASDLLSSPPLAPLGLDGNDAAELASLPRLEAAALSSAAGAHSPVSTRRFSSSSSSSGSSSGNTSGSIGGGGLGRDASSGSELAQRLQRLNVFGRAQDASGSSNNNNAPTSVLHAEGNSFLGNAYSSNTSSGASSLPFTTTRKRRKSFPPSSPLPQNATQARRFFHRQFPRSDYAVPAPTTGTASADGTTGPLDGTPYGGSASAQAGGDVSNTARSAPRFMPASHSGCSSGLGGLDYSRSYNQDSSFLSGLHEPVSFSMPTFSGQRSGSLSGSLGEFGYDSSSSTFGGYGSFGRSGFGYAPNISTTTSSGLHNGALADAERREELPRGWAPPQGSDRASLVSSSGDATQSNIGSSGSNSGNGNSGLWSPMERRDSSGWSGLEPASAASYGTGAGSVLLGVFEARHRAHGRSEHHHNNSTANTANSMHSSATTPSSRSSSTSSSKPNSSSSSSGLGSALATQRPFHSSMSGMATTATNSLQDSPAAQNQAITNHNPDLAGAGATALAAAMATGGASAAAAAATAAAPPPAFSDLVRRSTRFVTNRHAADVLSGLENIVLNRDVPVPYPYDATSSIDVALSWDDYCLDVHWAGELVYSVHIFLLPPAATATASAAAAAADGVAGGGVAHRGGGSGGAGGGDQFMVEFRRGNMDIFVFKRYYEALVDRLQQLLYASNGNGIEKR